MNKSHVKEYSNYHLLAITVFTSALYLYFASKFSSWIIDDAGISFAYSRSLANGFGLVAQPGVKPVEGFSNPTWVFLFALLDWLGFDILQCVKHVSFILMVVSFFIASKICYKVTQNYLLTLISSCGIALQPSIIIWSISGLENPLYVFLFLLFIWTTIIQPNNQRALLAGILAGLIALTRPEGFVFFIIYLLAHNKFWKPYISTFFLLFGSYFVFRLIYFGFPLPNTFYMKADIGRNFSTIISETIYNFWTVQNALFGKFGLWVGTIIFVYLFSIIIHKKIFPPEFLTILFASLLSFCVFLIMPPDWMGEVRFGTLFFAIFPILASTMIFLIINLIGQKYSLYSRWAGFSILFIWIVVNLFTWYIPRINLSSKYPTVPFSTVYRLSFRINEMAEAGGIENYSVLQADAGGSLWLDKYRLIDLGGLVDPVISRTLNKNPNKFLNYILIEKKPSIIEQHGNWSGFSNLQDDPRFMEDYQPICTYTEDYFQTSQNHMAISGIFVRKELVTSETKLQKMIDSIGKNCNK